MFGKFYNYYIRNIFPKVSHLRGSTRFNAFLLKAALKEGGVSDNTYFVEETPVKMTFFRHLVTLVDEEEYFQEFLSEVGEDDVVVDVGCAHGTYSCAAAAKTGEKIFAFDIEEESVEETQENADLNGFDNIEVFNNAVSDEECVVEVETGQGGSSSISKEGNSEVESTTLDKFFSDIESVPDVIKMDIEGAEMKALRGAENVIEKEKSVIFLELHKSYRIEEFDHKPEQVLNFLKERGYELENIEEHEADALYIARPEK